MSFPRWALEVSLARNEDRHFGLPGQWGGGIDVRISRRLHLEFSYRYVDLGDVETHAGDIVIARPDVEFSVPVGKTRADFAVEEFLVSLRYHCST